MAPRRSVTRWLRFLPAAAGALALAACGGSNASGTSAVTQIQASLSAFLTDLGDGNGSDACARLTAAAAKKTAGSFGSCKGALLLASAFVSKAQIAADQKKIAKLTIVVKGSRATYRGKPVAIYTNGRWLLADSSIFGNSNGSSGAATSVPSPHVAQGWGAKFCTLKPGMTRAQTYAIMGHPTDAFPLSSGTPQASWSAYEFQYNAFYNSYDRVRQLDINDIELSKAEKAALRCATTRVG